MTFTHQIKRCKSATNGYPNETGLLWNGILDVGDVMELVTDFLYADDALVCFRVNKSVRSNEELYREIMSKITFRGIGLDYTHLYPYVRMMSLYGLRAVCSQPWPAGLVNVHTLYINRVIGDLRESHLPPRLEVLNIGSMTGTMGYLQSSIKLITLDGVPCDFEYE